MNIEIEQKLEQKLIQHLNREPKPNELANAKTDKGLLVQVLLDEVEEIKSRLDKLEKK